jgi:hypothetical protein
MAAGKPSKSPKRARDRAVAVQTVGATTPAEAAAVDVVEAKATSIPTSPAVAEDGASLEADRVDVTMTAIGRVESAELSVARGAVGAARTGNLRVDQGAVGAVMADHAEVDRGYVRSILARQVQLDRSGARVVIAADVNAQQTAVMFLIARRVSGEVRVLFDWRGALAFGAAVGFVMALLARRRRRGG